MPFGIRSRLAIACVAGVSSATASALDLGFTKGAGADGFHSTGVDVVQVWQDGRWRADASYYLGESHGSGPEQYTGTVFWQFVPRLSAALSYQRTSDDVSTNTGEGLSLGWTLNAGRMETHPATLTVTYGRMTLDPNNPRVGPNLLAIIPKQSHVLASWAQQVTTRWSANLSYNSYHYSKDPIVLARAVILMSRRFANVPLNGAFVALGFPDHVISAGVGFIPNDQYTIGLTYSDVRSVIDQGTASVALNVARSLGRYTVSGNLSQSRIDALKLANGAVVIPGSTGVYFDLRVGASF